MTATLSGCGVTKELCRYTWEQLEYHEIADECLSTAKYRHLAQADLDQYAASNPECRLSQDFAAGFIDGFVDYVNEGPGGTPTIPPRCYWKVFHENPEGHDAALDWLHGFRAGAVAAEQSGYREFAIVPVAPPR
jgi:hypothetical protein